MVRHWRLQSYATKILEVTGREFIVSTVARPKMRVQKVTNLRYWMLRVLDECDHVATNFAADPVHDLRVALRRCRSVADGVMALDPDPDWKAMKKAGKRLFQRLGELRDIHVMMEWIEKLSIKVEVSEAASLAPNGENNPEKPSEDAAAHALLEILHRREREQEREAQAALEEFDRKQWRQWSKSLPTRAGRIRPGSALFKHLALERWTAARELHTRALRNRSQVAFHSLRIGIKRLRYIVENFLPAEHKAWSGDLKEIQDLLGEVHDLDVLWSTAVSCQIFPDVRSRSAWRERILAERTQRIHRYRTRMVGPDSLWPVWRASLPQGKQIHMLATQRMKLWANTLDPDFAHSERVAGLALQLYDGLLGWGWTPAIDAISARSSLLAAALLHDVGKSDGEKGHHKASFDLIREHGNPLGWSEADMGRAAIVARFHRGALPTRRHKMLRDLMPDEQKGVIQIAAVLRLANALDTAHDGRIRRVQIETVRNGAVARRQSARVNSRKALPARSIHEPLVLAAEGYSSTSPVAQIIAAERHLLETVIRRPVVIKAMSRPRVASRTVRALRRT
jgi:CHAD domain-containing protein/HD superfamily phosphodiesterase